MPDRPTVPPAAGEPPASEYEPPAAEELDRDDTAGTTGILASGQAV